MTGQAVEIPWAPGANYTRIICRLGEPRPDGTDAEEYPDLMTQGGSVTLTCTAKRIRYAEEDGRSRMLTTRPWTFKVRLADGELYNPESGNVGVKILSGSSAGVDPAGFTWTATVTPDNGESWSCTIPPTAGATFDLVSNADVVAPNPGESTLSARVAALEASSGGGGGGGIDTEAVQDIVGSMVTGAGGSYNDAAGTITLPGGGSSFPIQYVTLTSNHTQSTSGWPTDQPVAVVYTQDATGSRSVTHDGQPVTIKTLPGSETMVVYTPINSTWWPKVIDGIGVAGSGGTPPVDPISVTASAPTWTDDTVNGGGTWTNATTTGVTYSPASGTATPGQSVTVTATAQSGYTLTGTTSWTHTFPSAPAVTGTLTYRATDVRAEQSGAQTWAGVDIGAASPTREVIVMASWWAAGAREVLGMTIGGVTATLDYSTSFLDRGAALYRANVPTGTTADVVATLHASSMGVALSAWTVDQHVTLTGGTWADFDAGTAGSVTNSTAVNGGFALAGFRSRSDAFSTTWTGATERHDSEAAQPASVADTTTTGATTVSVAFTPVSSMRTRVTLAAYRWGS